VWWAGHVAGHGQARMSEKTSVGKKPKKKGNLEKISIKLLFE